MSADSSMIEQQVNLILDEFMASKPQILPNGRVRSSYQQLFDRLVLFANEVRRSALEEAANRADTFVNGEIRYWTTGNEIGVSIRNLIAKDQP